MEFLEKISTIFQTLSFITKPEYLALIMSVIILCYSNLRNKKDRNFNFQKEKYFKYQQIAEKIIAKIAIIEHDRERFIVWIENTHQTKTEESTIFIDKLDIFNVEKMNKDSEETAALLQIYFPKLCGKRDNSLQNIREIYNEIIILDSKIKNKHQIDRETTINKVNIILERLGDKPKEMINDIMLALEELEKSIIKI